VVFRHPSEKYEFVSWGYYSQLNGKIKKCSKPPTRLLSNPISGRIPWILMDIIQWHPLVIHNSSNSMDTNGEYWILMDITN
jgi:hypothetical protein